MPTTLGPQKTAVIMCKFPDTDVEPFTAPVIDHEVFDIWAPWIAACSYGRASLQKVGIYGWAMMPHPHAWYAALPQANYFMSNGYWYGQAPAELFQDAFALLNGFCDAYALKFAIRMYTGWGPTMGMGMNLSAHYADYTRPLLHGLAHEGGHQMGMLHAGTVDGPGDIPPNLDDLSQGGFTVGRYTDHLDTMGNGAGQYGAFHKGLCGWINPAESKNMFQGTVVLANVDGPGPVPGAYLELRIDLDAKHAYSLERRAGIGVIVRLICKPPQMAGAMQVDIDTALMRRGAPLQVGVPFTDPSGPIVITVVSDNGTQATVNVSRP